MCIFCAALRIKEFYFYVQFCHPIHKLQKASKQAHLDVDVAEGSSKCGHGVLDLHGRCVDAEVDVVLQSAVATRWAVVKRDGSRDGGQSSREILVLPDPPRAVDLCVVEVETRMAT